MREQNFEKKKIQWPKQIKNPEIFRIKKSGLNGEFNISLFTTTTIFWDSNFAATLSPTYYANYTNLLLLYIIIIINLIAYTIKIYYLIRKFN